MRGDVQICTAVFGAALDYGTNSGFYLITGSRCGCRTEIQKMLAIVFQLVDRLVHIRQGRVTLLLLEALVDIGAPAFGQ